jgi:hypothetical protein
MQELFWDIKFNGMYIGTAPDSLKDTYVRWYLLMNNRPDVHSTDHIEYALRYPVNHKNDLDTWRVLDLA